MKATIIFDGVCGFCNAYVQFVIRHDPHGYFSFVSAQSTPGRLLRANRVATDIDSIVLVEDNRVYLKSEAVLQIARRLAAPWRYVWWLRWLPQRFRDGLYDQFARRRYWFGTAKNCQLLTTEQRSRILLADKP